MKNKNKKLRKIATLSLGITFPVISVASAVADLNSDAEIKIDNLNITLDTSKILEGKNNLISKEHVFSSFFVGSKINLHSSVKINNLNAGNVSMSREVQWKNTSVEYIDQDFHVDFNENDLINIKDWNALSFALSFDIQDAGSNEDSGMYGNVDEIKYALWQDSGIDITKYDVYVSGMDWQVNTSTRHSDDLFWNGWKHTQELHMNKISFTLKQKENFVVSQIEGTKVLTAVMLSKYGIYNQIGVLKGYNPLSFTEQRIVMRDFLFIKDIDNNTVEYETTNRDDISWWNKTSVDLTHYNSKNLNPGMNIKRLNGIGYRSTFSEHPLSDENVLLHSDTNNFNELNNETIALKLKLIYWYEFGTDITSYNITLASVGWTSNLFIYHDINTGILSPKRSRQGITMNDFNFTVEKI